MTSRDTLPEESYGAAFERVLSLADDLTRSLTKDEMVMVSSGLAQSTTLASFMGRMEASGLPGHKRNHLIQRLERGSFADVAFPLAIAIAELARLDPIPRTEICWTGPIGLKKVRLLEPLLLDEIANSKRRIIVLAYSISDDSLIINALKAASDRGVRLVFMIDKLEKKPDFMEWVRTLSPSPELYSRPEDTDDPMSALHAKCFVIDDRIAIVGSANQTYHGLSGNIELGLAVQDGVVIESLLETIGAIGGLLKRIDL